MWQAYALPRVVVGDGEVTVVNPMRTLVLPMALIEDVVAGSSLVFRLGDGEVVRAWAVQAANGARLTGVESHADRVAAEIRSAVERHRSETAPGPGTSPAVRSEGAPVRAASARVCAVYMAVTSLVMGVLTLAGV